MFILVITVFQIQASNLRKNEKPLLQAKCIKQYIYVLYAQIIQMVEVDLQEI